MTEPLVSIKMITYNHAPYITNAIEGVLQQRTNFPFELVIGEDCSTDKTREIVFEYQKKYPDIIRVITSENNVGMNINGRRTTDACRGKYLAFCEGDDYWINPSKLQKQVDYMESHPECGMISADCDIYYNSTGKIKKGFNYNNGFRSIRHLNIEQVLWGDSIFAIWTCTVMVRNELLKKVQKGDAYLHNNNMPLGDMQTWAEISMISDVIYFPETWAVYRVLNESASRSKDIKKKLRFEKAIYEIKSYLCDKYSLPESRKLMAESSWCDASLRLALVERNFMLAQEVKKKRKSFTWKEWLKYFGSKYIITNYCYRTASLLASVFRKKSALWP